LCRNRIKGLYGASPLERPASRARIVIIGIGNEFQGDDGVGPFVVQELRARGLPEDVVSFQCREGLTLMELWRDKEMAILVDAAISGAAPGSVFRFEAQMESPPSESFRLNTHNYGLPEAIEIGKALNSLPPHVIVYGIEGKRFDVGMGLSPDVETAAEGVVQSIVKEVWGAGVRRL
jgi:hydrogenase maturation protease